jgi:type VI protein secretion system component VasK
MSYRWSLGTLIGLPLLVLLAIVCALVAWLLWRHRRRADDFDRGPATVIAIACALGCAATIVGTAWGMWPYNAEYHQWRTESGTITQVDSRLIGQNKSTTQRFVVTLDGDRQRSCDDTRCAELRVGDDVTLSCKRAWQYSGSHGYDCNFVSRKRGTQ